jgi:hypothetical protein
MNGGTDALGHRLSGIICEVRVASGATLVLMPEQLAGLKEGMTLGNGDGRHVVAKVV